ncbi:MAG: glycosyltransferase family 39 protein [Anaerolineae bacterium]|nr:glycosyltransferase family 39 protein [Anaerolineae bacterium]
MFHDNYKILALLIGLIIVRGLIYIAIIPPWLAPDEPAHFEAIRLIGQEGLLPTRDAYLTTPMHPEMHASFQTFQVWQLSRLAPPQAPRRPDQPSSDLFIDYYPPTSTGSLIIAGNYPLVYHQLMAPLSALIRNLSLVQQVYIMRLVSLLLTTLTVVCGWFFGRTIFPAQMRYALGLTSFLVFLPMHLHVDTAINSDVLVVVLVALYFLGLAKIFCKGPSLPWLIITALALGAAVITKPTSLFILPTTGVALLLYGARRFYWKPRLLAGLLPVVIAIAFIGSIVLFQVGDGGRAVSTLDIAIEQPVVTGNYFSPAALAVYAYTIQWGFLSFWGLFGWANIPVLATGIRVVWLVCLGVGLGVVIFGGRHLLQLGQQRRTLTSQQQDILLVLLCSLIFALISVYTPIIATQSTRWGPPARYFFPALLPLALYFFLGYQQLIPARFYRWTLPLWLTALFLFDTFTLAFVLIPYIYG